MSRTDDEAYLKRAIFSHEPLPDAIEVPGVGERGLARKILGEIFRQEGYSYADAESAVGMYQEQLVKTVQLATKIATALADMKWRAKFCENHRPTGAEPSCPTCHGDRT